MRTPFPRLAASALMLAALVWPHAAAQAEDAQASATPSSEADPAVIEDYCREFASNAAEARTQHQREELEKLQAAVNTQMTDLQAKTAELKEWVQRREEIQDRASKNLTKIYSVMEPDAAARQMEKMDPETVSAILRSLNAKSSSEILAAMDVDKASRVIKTMAEDAARKTGS